LWSLHRESERVHGDEITQQPPPFRNKYFNNSESRKLAWRSLIRGDFAHWPPEIAMLG
jgi:hypothetical protein